MKQEWYTNPNYPSTSDPDYQQHLNLAYDSGDHTHPSNAGLAAKANAVDLSTLTPSGGTPTSQITWNGTGKCVDRDVASGRVQIWDCLGGSNQLWTLNADGSLTTGGVCVQLPAGQTWWW